MSQLTIRAFIIVSVVLSSGFCTGDRIIYPSDDGVQNNPQPDGNGGIRPRFSLPSKIGVQFGDNNAHSVGIARTEDGYSLSQSTSFGNKDVAASKSNSLSLGKGGVGVADSGAYNFFGQSDARSDTLAVGDADAKAQADVKDGKVSSGAQTSAGQGDNKVSSGASSSADRDNAQADANADAKQNNQYPSGRRFFGQRNPNGPFGLPFAPSLVPHRDSGLRVNVGKFHGHAPHQWQNGNGDVQIRKERPNGSGLEVNVERYNPHVPTQWNNGNNQPHGLDINIAPHNPSGPNQWNRRNHQGHPGPHFSRPNRDHSWDRYNNNQYPNGPHFVNHQNHQNYPNNQFNPNPNYQNPNYQNNQYHQNQNYQNQNFQNHFGQFPQSQFQQNQGGTKTSIASASSSASSTGNGFAFGQSSSQSNLGPGGPSSQTKNQLHTSGHAQSHAQGAAAGIQQNAAGQTQASLSSGVIGGSSSGHGQATGSAVSGNRGEHSRGEVQSSANGSGSVAGNANAAGVSFDDPPRGQLSDDYIPDEFLRSGNSKEGGRAGGRQGSPVRKILEDVRGAVRDILHQ